MKRKRKTYDSEREFEADRKQMWGKGWLVVERRMIPLAKPSWAPWGSQASLALLIYTLPLFLFGWLIYRKTDPGDLRAGAIAAGTMRPGGGPGLRNAVPVRGQRRG